MAAKPLAISRAEVAALLGISLSTVNRWMKLSLIPFRRVAGRVLFHRPTIERWISSGGGADLPDYCTVERDDSPSVGPVIIVKIDGLGVAVGTPVDGYRLHADAGEDMAIPIEGLLRYCELAREAMAESKGA